MPLKEKPYHLLHNSRFYILASSVLISVLVIAWVRLSIPSDQLFYIRAQQLFGLLAVAYWYLALIISPIGYIIGKQRTKKLEFARRAIGVSAFYFALLHGLIALWAQLGGPAQLQHLPQLFQWSLISAAAALVVLALLAATSFDAVIRFMTFRKWKWLHRLIYIGGVAAVLHIWTIGTHLAYTNVQIAAYCALVVLAGLELFRVTKLVNQSRLHFNRTEAGALFLAVWVSVAVAILALPAYVQNYHSRHANNDTVQDGQHIHGGRR